MKNWEAAITEIVARQGPLPVLQALSAYCRERSEQCAADHDSEGAVLWRYRRNAVAVAVGKLIKEAA